MKRVQSQMAFQEVHTAEHSPINHDDIGLCVDGQTPMVDNESDTAAAEEVSINSVHAVPAQLAPYYIGKPVVSPQVFYMLPMPTNPPIYQATAVRCPPPTFEVSTSPYQQVTHDIKQENHPSTERQFPLPGI